MWQVINRREETVSCKAGHVEAALRDVADSISPMKVGRGAHGEMPPGQAAVWTGRTHSCRPHRRGSSRHEVAVEFRVGNRYIVGQLIVAPVIDHGPPRCRVGIAVCIETE